MCRRNRNEENNNNANALDNNTDLTARAWDDLSSSLDEVVGVSGRTFDRLGNLMQAYHDRFYDRFFDGNGGPWGSWTPFGYDRSDGHGGRKMWAFPVPSARQYEKCVDKEGVSAWNRDGVWKCLFPKSAEEHRALFEGTSPDYFKEYNALLEFRRKMRKAEAERERQRWTDTATLGTSTKPADNGKLRYVSESDAEKAGKTVVSSQVWSETVSKDDGTLETKRVVKKFYDDNTASVSETVDSGTRSGSGSGSGWFWH